MRAHALVMLHEAVTRQVFVFSRLLSRFPFSMFHLSHFCWSHEAAFLLSSFPVFHKHIEWFFAFSAGMCAEITLPPLAAWTLRKAFHRRALLHNISTMPDTPICDVLGQTTLANPEPCAAACEPAVCALFWRTRSLVQAHFISSATRSEQVYPDKLFLHELFAN